MSARSVIYTGSVVWALMKGVWTETRYSRFDAAEKKHVVFDPMVIEHFDVHFLYLGENTPIVGLFNLEDERSPEGVDITVAPWMKEGYTPSRTNKEAYRAWAVSQPELLAKIKEELAGKHLLCTCNPTQPCHGRVLIELANFHKEEETMEANNTQESAPFGNEDMGNYEFIVGVTGSRSLQTAPVEDQQRILDHMTAEFTRLKEKYGSVLVITGMAEGFDALCARAAQLAEVDYWCAIPSPDYADYWWKSNSQLGYDRSEVFQGYVDKAVGHTFVCDKHLYRGAEMNIRNEWIVSRAQGFYAYPVGSRGGTRDCMNRIKNAGLPIIVVR